MGVPFTTLRQEGFMSARLRRPRGKKDGRKHAWHRKQFGLYRERSEVLRTCFWMQHRWDKHKGATEDADRPTNSVDYEERGYQTLGMRILQSFDRHILDMLESVDSLHTHAADHTLEKAQPAVSVNPALAHNTSTATSINSHGLLQSRTTTPPPPSTAASTASSID